MNCRGCNVEIRWAVVNTVAGIAEPDHNEANCLASKLESVTAGFAIEHEKFLKANERATAAESRLGVAESLRDEAMGSLNAAVEAAVENWKAKAIEAERGRIAAVSRLGTIEKAARVLVFAAERDRWPDRHHGYFKELAALVERRDLLDGCDVCGGAHTNAEHVANSDADGRYTPPSE